MNIPFTPPPKTPVPILQDLISAYKLWHEYAKNLPQGSRYTLGTRITNLFVETVELLFCATYAIKEQKLAYLRQAAIKLDLLKFLLQVAWELKDIKTNNYATLFEPLAEIGRKLGGWIRRVESEIKTPATMDGRK